MAKLHNHPSRKNKKKQNLSSQAAVLGFILLPLLILLVLSEPDQSEGFFNQFFSPSEEIGETQFSVKERVTEGAVPKDAERSAPEERSWTQLDNKAWQPPQYELQILADHLSGPGGLVSLPYNGTVLVSEEYANRISAITKDGSQSVWASVETPIFAEDDTHQEAALPALRSPEGVALGDDGTLYVAEDYPGGRLIRFFPGDNGKAAYGEQIHLPGHWHHVAWEDVDISKDGRLLLAGSDTESLQQRKKTDFFSGTIIYRDQQGDWWSPYSRLFASFSTVSFSKNENQALYTCELTGEMGWIDLRQKVQQGGFCTRLFKTPEALCLSPDGSALIGEEGGKIYSYDPALDTSHVLPQPIDHIEALSWDSFRGGVLVADDTAGRVLFLRPTIAPDAGLDRMKLARYEAVLSRMHIPETSPDFLSQVLALGGLDYSRDTEPKMGFRQFTARIPVLAADAKLTPTDHKVASSDPLEQLQFVIFEPNKVSIGNNGLTTALAGFYARTRSGKTITTSTRHMEAKFITWEKATSDPIGLTTIVAPHASAITVSPMGIASIQFMGLGITADFSIVLNPHNPADSYLIEFEKSGTKNFYHVDLPPHAPEASSWVVAYSDQFGRGWKPLEVSVQ